MDEPPRAHQELEEKMRVAAVDVEVGNALKHSSGLHEILNRSAGALVRHLDAAHARIWTLNPHTDVLDLQSRAGTSTSLDDASSCIPVGELRLGWIASELRPYVTDNLSGDPLANDHEWAEREGIVAFGGYPLIVGDQLVGVVALFARKPLRRCCCHGAHVHSELHCGGD